jgi:putative endonuclease
MIGGVEKMHYVYVVKCSDDTLYTGYTTNVKRRIYEHNNSTKAGKYTRYRRPVKLLYSEEFKTRSGACMREYEIKKMSRINKLELIENVD